MKIFWSWQDVVSPKTNRHFIKAALEDLVAQLAGDHIVKSKIFCDTLSSWKGAVKRVILNNICGLRKMGIIAALVFPIACSAATGELVDTPFSGRWRIDTGSLKGNFKPTALKVAKGFFKKDDLPPIMADGKFHRVTGDGYVDETSISIVSDQVVREVDRVRGRLAYTVDYEVSNDGQMLTWHVASYTNPEGKAVEGVTIQRRVGAVNQGDHLVSGKWARVSVSVDSRSDWILKLVGNRFIWRSDYGTGYDAVIGGEPVKIDGDSSGSRALATRPQHDTVVVTNLSKSGKRESVLTMQILPDGDTILGTALSNGFKQRTTFFLKRVIEK